MGFFKNFSLKKKNSKNSLPSASSPSSGSPTSTAASTPSKWPFVPASGPLTPSPYLRSSFDRKLDSKSDGEEEDHEKSSSLDGFPASMIREPRKDDSRRTHGSVSEGAISDAAYRLKGSFRGLIPHQEKTVVPTRSSSMSERPGKHHKKPSLDAILRNMYGTESAARAAGVEFAHMGNDRTSVTATRSGQLAPRDSGERESVRTTKSRSGVMSPRDWHAGQASRSGQLSPVDSLADESTYSSPQTTARAARIGQVAPAGGSGTLQAVEWSGPTGAATSGSQVLSEGILQPGRSQSGQLAPRDSGYGFGLERPMTGPRSMSSSRGKDVYQGERQQKGAAQRRLNRNRGQGGSGGSTEEPINRAALARGRLDTWQEAISEGDENGSGQLVPSASGGSGPKISMAPGSGSLRPVSFSSAKSRLQQSEVLFSSSRAGSLAGLEVSTPGENQTASERMAASLMQAQRIARGTSSGQLAPSMGVGGSGIAPIRVRQEGPVDNVLNRPFSNVREKYQLQMEELGRGRFGVIRVCLDRTTGERLACKSISKARLKAWQDAEDVRKEVTVLELLQGHPHVVTLRGCFEDALNVHLVMELCEGGELFHRIMAKKRYSEPEAAIVCRTVIGVLRYCHALGYIHRDLKPENILLCSKDSDTVVKVIDFGVATAYTRGIPCIEEVGTPFYLAPEVLNKCYGPEADIWSAGVVLYILLCGVPPFWANDTEGIKAAILSGRLDLTSGSWKEVSELAKDLVRQMLVMDPEGRIKVDQILAHPWIVNLGRV